MQQSVQPGNMSFKMHHLWIQQHLWLVSSSTHLQFITIIAAAYTWLYLSPVLSIPPPDSESCTRSSCCSCSFSTVVLFVVYKVFPCFGLFCFFSPCVPHLDFLSTSICQNLSCQLHITVQTPSSCLLFWAASFTLFTLKLLNFSQCLLWTVLMNMLLLVIINHTTIFRPNSTITIYFSSCKSNWEKSYKEVKIFARWKLFEKLFWQE